MVRLASSDAYRQAPKSQPVSKMVPGNARFRARRKEENAKAFTMTATRKKTKADRSMPEPATKGPRPIFVPQMATKAITVAARAGAASWSRAVKNSIGGNKRNNGRYVPTRKIKTPQINPTDVKTGLLLISFYFFT